MAAGDERLIRALQDGLPPVLRPYGRLGNFSGMSEQEVLDHLSAMKADGRLRRMAAVVNQRQVGLQGNVLAVWNVLPERVDQVGRHLAAREEITHAYLRPRGAEWPYNLYTMVHGESDEACAEKIESWAAELDISDYRLLATVREWKKSVPVYSADDWDD